MPRSRSPEYSSQSTYKRSKHSNWDRSPSPTRRVSSSGVREDDHRRRHRESTRDQERDRDWDRDHRRDRSDGYSRRDDKGSDRKWDEPPVVSTRNPSTSNSTNHAVPTTRPEWTTSSSSSHPPVLPQPVSTLPKHPVPSPNLPNRPVTSIVPSNSATFSHSASTPNASAATSNAPATTTNGASKPAAPQTDEEKQNAKRAKLAAWKAAKQQASGGSSPATPSSPAPTTPSSSSINTLPSTKSAPGKMGISFGTGSAALSRIGLPLKPSSLSISSTFGSRAPTKSNLGSTLDDGPAPVRKLEMLGDLPEVDTEVNVKPDDDDDEELDREFKASVKDGERGKVSMDVEEPTPLAVSSTTAPLAKQEEEEEEEDPLEAYMRGVTEEKAKVDLQDSSRMKNGGVGPKQSRALGMDDDEGNEAASSEEDEPKQEPGELDRALTAEDIIALAAKRNRRKELATVDHSVVEYEPFRKSFYTPPYEVSQMTDEDVELMRLDMDGIKIRGVDCPRPVRRWGAFGLPGGCLEVIKRLGYEEPTSIQAQAVPAIMTGRDVIGVAKTGSGKTIAFLLPLFRHINDQRALETGEGPIALIMTPTRELALQIVKECKPFTKVLGITAMCAYGGSPISEQIAEMKKGAEIVVCTPGRMIDLLTANSGRVTNLRRVTYMVLDEADRMFDMGFEPQVMKIINNVRPDRQVVLFSATFPKQMDGLARKILQKPLEVTVGGRSVVAKEITQLVEVRTEESKFHRLLELLGETYQNEDDLETKRTLIFVERQESADNLLLQLHKSSYRRANSLHGGKEQVDRDQTITNFKSGVVPIVIATSVAARGLDVKQLVLVVNYDVPNHMEDYVHRAGRTGRAGNKGTCVTFITSEQEKFSVDICRAVEASGTTPSSELKALSDGFLAKVRSGAAKSYNNTGFGGKGLDRLDTEREAQLAKERSAFGGDEKDGPDKEAESKDKKTDAAAGKDEHHDILKDWNPVIVAGPAPERVGQATQERKRHHDRPPPRSNEPAPLVAGGPNQEGLTKVQAALQKINAELAAKRKAMAEGHAAAPSATSDGTPNGGLVQKANVSENRKPKDPDATDFHAVVQINDFVQKARWMVTNRESMTKLIDLTGTAITNRGVYYEPGKEPPAGAEPKLSLLIESNDEWRVEMAVKEIRRLLIEGSIQAAAHDQRTGGNQPTGRYSVV